MLGGNTYGTAIAIAPDDNKNYQPMLHALYVGVTGSVAVETSDGTVVNFVAVPAGTILPLQIRKVKSTGTGASSLVGLAS